MASVERFDQQLVFVVAVDTHRTAAATSVTDPTEEADALEVQREYLAFARCPSLHHGL
jgi:hypothetical protein